MYIAIASHRRYESGTLSSGSAEGPKQASANIEDMRSAPAGTAGF